MLFFHSFKITNISFLIISSYTSTSLSVSYIKSISVKYALCPGVVDNHSSSYNRVTPLHLCLNHYNDLINTL